MTFGLRPLVYAIDLPPHGRTSLCSLNFYIQLMLACFPSSSSQCSSYRQKKKKRAASFFPNGIIYLIPIFNPISSSGYLAPKLLAPQGRFDYPGWLLHHNNWALFSILTFGIHIHFRLLILDISLELIPVACISSVSFIYAQCFLL